MKRLLSAGFVAMAVGLAVAVAPATPTVASEVRKAKVGKEFTYSEWCWEQPGETMLQIKESGAWKTVATEQVAEDDACDSDAPFSATLTWTPDRAGTFKAREYRPATADLEAEWMSFTLKIAAPAPIKIKLGKRYTYDYCLPDPGYLKLQVKSGNRWKMVDSTNPAVDAEACEDPAYPYSATMTWKPAKPGTYTLRDYQSATATTEAGSYQSFRIKVSRPARGEGGSSDWGYGSGGSYGGTTGFCNDGWISSSIGKSGACSHHGGVAGGTSSYSPSIGSTYVSGYFRSDGTYVSGYYRR